MSGVVRRGTEAGAKTVAAWGLRRGLALVLGPTLAGLAGTNLLTAIAYGVIMQATAVHRRARGELTEDGLRVESFRNVGWAIGAFVGMSVGGIVGSVVPVVGTLVLSMLLGGLGGLVGAGAGRVLGWTVVGRPRD